MRMRVLMLCWLAASLVACASVPDAVQREAAASRLALAQAYFEQGQPQVASQEVQRSLAIDAHNPRAHVLSGLVWMDLNRFERARASFDRALVLDPQSVSAWHNRAWLSCQQGAWEQAHADFEQALLRAQGADRVQALMVQGVCAAQAQSWSLAEQRLTQALDLEPNNTMARHHWAQVQQEQGRWAQAQMALERLNTSPHARPESLLLAIRGAQELGDAAAVVRWAQELERRFPQSPQWDAYQRKSVNVR